MKEIEDELTALSRLKETEKIIQERIKQATPQHQQSLLDLESKANKIVEERNRLEAEMREAAASLYSKLDQVSDKISSAQIRIRRIVHGIPAQEAADGRKIRVGSAQVTVSRVAVNKTYSTDLLDKLPWLAHYKLDGNDLVETIVKPHMIDMMLDRNEFNDADRKIVLDSQIFMKVRAPSVKFRFDEEKK